MLHAIFIAIYLLLVILTLRSRRAVINSINEELYEAEPDIDVPPQTKRVARLLQNALPSCILLPSNIAPFNASASNYFAQQSTTTKPACIVRPKTVKQLSQAVAILHQEFLTRKADGNYKHNNLGFVSLRSGGHSYARASASIDGGVLIDLSGFSDVTISDDGSSVTVGTGARWSKVYEVLEAKKIAIPGGRNGAVGVGGFTLGGKLCFTVSLDFSLLILTRNVQRRYLILLTEVWISLLKRHRVRGGFGFWTSAHCFRNKERKTMACAQRRRQ